MPVYIATDYSGKTIDVVLSRNRELAHAYWHGKGIIPHSSREITENDLVGHPTGVLPIVTTREVQPHHIDRMSMTPIRVIDK